MISMITGIRSLFNKLSFRSLSINICNKYTKKYSFYTNFVGYVEPLSIKYYNNRDSMSFCVTKRSFTSLNDKTKSSERLVQIFYALAYPLEICKRELDSLKFEKISEETLDSLTEYFDELVDRATHLKDADVTYGDGVLTIKFGDDYGTYVINRQTPNKQIWLSSPKSGPKRYDFVAGQWIYKRDGKSLHRLLDDEIPNVVKSETNFRKCLYGCKKNTND